MLSRRRVRGFFSVLLASAAVLMGSAQGARADPIYLPWPSLLPGLIDQYVPDNTNDCVAGRPVCSNAILDEMKLRFGPLGQSCNHQAVFALAYLRTTQTFQWAQAQPGYFQDPGYVNHEAAVFAKYYFSAYDNWSAGSRAAVPQAWLIALDNAGSKRTTGTGDLLLGMNAHINRDLPFVLAAIGLATPTGQSRKPDHDKVDEFLNLVTEPLLIEEIARMDSSIINLTTPYGVGYTGLFQLIAVWRELAWHNAELLLAAPTAQARAIVATTIETTAATEATALAAGNLYVPPLITTTTRDTFCAGHNGVAPPAGYAFGATSAY
ncbi:MAG: hypothetical protein V7637_1383 [Mycobacteriales bacterium]